MFCTKCGNKIKDGAKFCSVCGAPVAGIAKSANVTRGMQNNPYNVNTQGFGMNNVTVTNAMAQIKSKNNTFLGLCAGGAVLQIIIYICRHFDFCKMPVGFRRYLDGRTAEVIMQKTSMNQALCDSDFSVLFLLLTLIAAACCILPIFIDKFRKTYVAILPIITSIWNLLMIGLCVINAADAASQDSDAKWTLLFGGWLCIIFTIASTTVSIKMLKKIKKPNI